MSDRYKITQKRNSENDYFRKNVLNDLLSQVDEATGRFDETWEIIIPQKERDDDFLWQVLTELGYSYTHREEYNSYHECFCYMVTVSK